MSRVQNRITECPRNKPPVLHIDHSYVQNITISNRVTMTVTIVIVTINFKNKLNFN